MKSLIKKIFDNMILMKKMSMFKRYYSNIISNPVELDSIPGNKIIILIPHPDDEIIGCGGLIFKLIEQNKQIIFFYNTVSESERIEELKKVNEITGIRFIINEGYYRKKLKEVIESEKPDVIIIPDFIENHADHYKIAEELYFVLKNRPDFKVKILMYEIWTPHQPNVVIEITNYIEKKIEVLKLYKSQLKNKDYINMVTGLNSYRAAYLKYSENDIEKKTKYAESFVLIHSAEEFVNLYEYSHK